MVMSNKKNDKKYYLTVTEEIVLNPKNFGFRGGRIEVYHPDHEYAVIEFRFFIPDRMMEGFRDWIEGQELTEWEMRNFHIDIDGGKIFE
jgi:hypothetical protein